jgi:tetratricopeptide (TPR) repeat protein
MKHKILPAAFLMLLFTSAHAQNARVQTAFNYYKYNRVESAIPEIEAAIQHEQTRNKEKTWYYRGLIYDKICHDTILHKKYPEACRLAMESFSRSLSINNKSEYVEDIALRGISLFAMEFGRGVKYYNQKEYEKALQVFEFLLTIMPSDTLSMLNAGLSAEKIKDYGRAKNHFGKLIQMKYNNARVYQLYAVIQKAEGDTAAALQTLKQGRQIFSDDLGLIIEETNIYLSSNRSKEAIETLNIAIEKAPNNAQLYYARANNFSSLKETEKARSDYLKAISLDPQYFDAHYNMGAMLFNEGADLINRANNLPPAKSKEYEALKKQADAKFKECLPYLEKAYEIRPKDFDTLNTLKQLYARLGEYVKYEKIKAELDALK